MKALREAGLLLVMAALPALLGGWYHFHRQTLAWTKVLADEVEWTEVERWTGPVLWIDARTADAFAAQHVPGAVRLNEGEWERLLPGFLEAWQPEQRIVVYCDSRACDASQGVAQRLRRELNLTEIHVLKGGWNAWLQAHPGK